MVRKLLVMALMMSGMALPAQPAQAALNPFGDVCRGDASNTAVCKDRGGANRPFSLLRTVVDLLLFIAGIVAVVFIIIGGLRYVTSGGDQANIKAAKDTVLYAVIGLIIAIMAYAIVGFVVGRL